MTSIAANANAINTQTIRLDNLSGHIEEGSTTFDAEIVDARVGYNDVEYSSLGASIKAQSLSTNAESKFYRSSDLEWFLNLTLGSDTGMITGSDTYAISERIPAKRIWNYSSPEDENNVSLGLTVYEYNKNGTWLRRFLLKSKEFYIPSLDCAEIRLCFGRGSSTAIQITAEDLESYLHVEYIEENNIKNIVCGPVSLENKRLQLGTFSSTIGTWVVNTGGLNKHYHWTVKSLLGDCKQYMLKVKANSERSTVIGFDSASEGVYCIKNDDIFPLDNIIKLEAGEEQIIRFTNNDDHVWLIATNTSGNNNMPEVFEILPYADDEPEPPEPQEQFKEYKMQEYANFGLAHSEDYTSLSGYDSNYITDDGYAIPSGFSNKVLIDKYFVCDTISMKAMVNFNNTREVSLTLGTKRASYNSSSHATIVKFDFINSKVDFLAPSSTGGNYDGDTLPSAIYDTFPLVNIDGYKYTVEIGRIDRCPYARVWNRKTGKLCGEKVLTEYLTEASYGGKVGACYDFPTFAALTDNVIFERVILSAPADEFAAFVGDSITEGSQTKVVNSWANMAAEYLGNSYNYGRGGGTIDHVQKCITDILSVVKPKYVFITIGTNGGNTTSKLNNLVSSVKAFGGIPIINCISRCTARDDTAINNVILPINTQHIRFDIATSINNDLSQGQDNSLFNTDLVHPNNAGHLAMYKEFLSECSNIKTNGIIPI